MDVYLLSLVLGAWYEAPVGLVTTAVVWGLLRRRTRMGPTTALSAGFWSGGAALQLLWLVWPTWFLSVPALWFWLASSSVAVWALARREHAAAAWVCLAAPVVCVLLWVGTILTLNASM